MAKLLSPVNVLATTFSVEVAAVCALAIAASICPLLTAESAAVPSAIPLISLPPALIPSVLSIVTPPTVTLSKDTFFAVPMVILRPVFVTDTLSPLMKFTVSPPATAVLLLPLVDTFQVAAVLARSLICVSPAVDKLDKSLLAALAA